MTPPDGSANAGLSPSITTRTENHPMPKRRVMFGRALRRRCPICGGGPLFTGWWKMAERCPSCDFLLGRGEPGYALGGTWFNLLAAEVVGVGVLIGVVVATWPTPPWDRLQIMAPLDAVLTPIIFYPFSKTLFLAFDLCIRPESPSGRSSG